MTFSSSSRLILPRRICLTGKSSGLHANAYGRNEKCPSCHGLILLPRVLRSQNGESGEGCARFFQSRKTLSKHACVRRGVIDVKTGTAVQVPVPITNSSSAPPVTATSGGSQKPTSLSDEGSVSEPTLHARGSSGGPGSESGDSESTRDPEILRYTKR